MSHQLPQEIDRWIGILAKRYLAQKVVLPAEVLVNGHVKMVEGWEYDNLDGGTYGHALFLTLPEALYLKIVDTKGELAEHIRSDINRLHHVRNEFVSEVLFEVEHTDIGDWRRDSGLLQARGHRVEQSDVDRVWGSSGYRVFLSHKAGFKKETANVKKVLAMFGISAFVAHEDIHPTKEWQNEIEHALVSMEAFVALMTEDFHDSNWTDQEVGYAVCRGVPMIAVRLGADPYGFIGKFQALACGWSDVPEAVVKLLLKHSRMVDAYVGAMEKCGSFKHGNALAAVLPAVDRISDVQARALVNAFNTNSEAQGSFGLSGTYGPGLAEHLSRLTGREYTRDGNTIRLKGLA